MIKLKWPLRAAAAAASVILVMAASAPSASATSTSGDWAAGQLTTVSGPPLTQHYVTTSDYEDSISTYDNTGLTIDGYLAFKSNDASGYSSEMTNTNAWVQQNKLAYYTGSASGTPTCSSHVPSGSTNMYAGALAKTAYQELVNGGSASTELTLLRCLQGSITTGRFSDYDPTYGDYSNPFGQSFAIMDFTKTSSYTVAAAGAMYLVSQQCASGSTSGSFDSSFGTACSGADVDSTAMAAMALKVLANHTTGSVHNTALAAANSAASWLADQAVASGTGYLWDSTGCTGSALPSVNSTALAVIALVTVNGATDSHATGGQAWLEASPQTPASGEMPGCTDSNSAVQTSNDVIATTQGILGKDLTTYPQLLGI